MIVAGRVVSADQADYMGVTSRALGCPCTDRGVMRGDVERPAPGWAVTRGKPLREIRADQPAQGKRHAVR